MLDAAERCQHHGVHLQLRWGGYFEVESFNIDTGRYFQHETNNTALERGCPVACTTTGAAALVHNQLPIDVQPEMDVAEGFNCDSFRRTDEA